MTIGWKNVFQGRISRLWAELQQDHLSSLEYIKGHDGSHWAKSVLCHIMTKWNTLWDNRNADRHGKDQATRAISLKAQTLRELQSMYEYRDKVLQRDHSIFDLSLDDIKDKPHQYLRQWLHTHQTVILHSAASAKWLSILNVCTLPMYFPGPTATLL